jgi:hypothetical protein
MPCQRQPFFHDLVAAVGRMRKTICWINFHKPWAHCAVCDVSATRRVFSACARDG